MQLLQKTTCSLPRKMLNRATTGPNHPTEAQREATHNLIYMWDIKAQTHQADNRMSVAKAWGG